MKIFNNTNQLKKTISKYLSSDKTIGFVPTMGALHDGHLKLITTSLKETNITICSIYINPTQFNNLNDLNNYPKNHSEDLNKLKNVGCNIVFIPNNKEMYGNKLESNNYNLGNCLTVLEGQKRPGHFNGMLTIVEKLFSIVSPNKAYFGIKDFQQLWIIKQLLISTSSPIILREIETVRDPSGLALSSRNQHLTKNELISATKIFTALSDFKMHVHMFFSKSTKNLNNNNLKKYINQVKSNLSNDTLIKIDYFEVIDIENFSFAKNLKHNKQYRALIAAYVGETRLIDNILI